MITYTVKDETTTRARMLSKTSFTSPCFRVYREDGACMATYENAADAAADAAERMAEHANISWADIESEHARR